MAISFDELNKAIEQSGPDFQKELKKILSITGFEQERKAKINATSYPKVISGRLRSSIQGRAKDGMIILQAGGHIDGEVVDYAPYVELGTSKMAPRLFMKRAIDQEAPHLESRLKKLLVNAFKR